jgi:phage terminase small subunit
MATAQKEKPDATVKSTLTGKQEQFCLEYLIDFNATQAAIRAGYSEKTAKQIGQQNLSKLDVHARLTELKEARQKKATKTADDIERELEKLAFSDVTNVVTWNESGMCFVKNSDEIAPEHSAAIEQIEVTEKVSAGNKADDSMTLRTKVKHHSKLKALELLGKQKGMFADKVEVSGDEGFANILAAALNRAKEAKGEK